MPDLFKPPADGTAPTQVALVPAPKADEAGDAPAIIASAVLGLYPASNQGLLRDMQAMAGGESPAGPIESFVRSGVNFDQPAPPAAAPQQQAIAPQMRRFADERFVTGADPCQSRAVRLARQCKGLVIHGPPGTGKSQTITNIISDHLARGQKVLVVCDKRTALDVVANRLEHLGLGKLCALVHDPQRDQRDLYRAIREQLDALPEAKTDASAQGKLEKLDEELQKLHADLRGYRDALMDRGSDGVSFHELMGQWLALVAADDAGIDDSKIEMSLADLGKCEPLLGDILGRGQRADFAHNPWVLACGLTLAGYLSHPVSQSRSSLGEILSAAQAADATAHPAIPPFADGDLQAQAKARSELADKLEEALQKVDRPILARWGKDPAAAGRAQQRLAEVAPALEAFKAGSLDAELSAATRTAPPRLWVVIQQLGAIEGYLAIAQTWHAFVHFKRKREAAEVVRQYGLALDVPSATRLRGFLKSLRARLALQAVYDEFNGGTTAGLLADDVLDKSIAQHAMAVGLLRKANDDALRSIAPAVAAAMQAPDQAPVLLDGLRRSTPRAQALTNLESKLTSAALFDPNWLTFNSPIAPRWRHRRADHRQADRYAGDDRKHPAHPRGPAAVAAGAAPAGRPTAWGQRVARAGHQQHPQAGAGIRDLCRLAQVAIFQAFDAHRLETSFQRYRKLDEQRKTLVRDAILHQWTSRQKERLLAGTGSRLNNLGADLRRRLLLRGERALRLRQVVALGQQQYAQPADQPTAPSASIENPKSKIENPPGDPLFDLCPVWLASPETVAQVFPRADVRRGRLRRSIAMPAGRGPARAHAGAARGHFGRPAAAPAHAVLRVGHRDQR